MRVIEAPAPRPDRGSALVRTGASLISAGTEKQIIELARASIAGKALARPDLVRQTLRKVKSEGLVPVARKVLAKLDTPISLGYSLAGQVVEAGEQAGVAVGERVACAGAGIANHAEYNVVPANLMVRIPDTVSDEAASFVTVGAIALQGVRVANPTLGERVVVSGLGLIGLLTVQLLKANGCRVLAFDPNPARVTMARDLGADVAVGDGLAAATAAFTAGHGADAVIVTASTKSSDPLNQAAEISRMKGRVVVVGMVGMTIDRDPFYKRELDLRFAMSYGPGRYDPAYEQEGRDYPFAFVRWTEQRNLEAFLELVAAGRVTPERLITHRFPIADAESAYNLLDGDEPYLAILLTYPDSSEPRPVVTLAENRARPNGEGVAFIGAGNYARSVLLPAVARAGGCALRTVVTASAISAHGAAEKFGFARAATDPKVALADDEVATIFIATRHDSHAELAIAALQAGKNVFVEKPLALDREQLASVIGAARAAPGVLTVGFNRRFAPMIVEAKSALGPAPGPLVMTYRVNAGPIPRDHWVHGDPAVPKERIDIFAAGNIIEIGDFATIAISRNGRTRTRKAAQDKGQNRLVAAFLAAARGEAEPPIPVDELEAVSLATLELAGR